MASRQQKLARATRVLSRYYGIKTSRDLAERIALDNIRSTTPPTDSGDQTQSQGNGSEEGSTETRSEADLISLMIDTADGGLLTRDFSRLLRDRFPEGENGATATEADFGKLLQLHYEGGSNFVVRQTGSDPVNAFLPESFQLDDSTVFIQDVGVRQMLGYGAPSAERSVRINARPSEPTKEYPGLSVYVSNSPRVTLESQNTAPSTIFLNGIPNVELQRAMPFVNVEFFFPRPPKSEVGNRIQNMSLNKFLLGGVQPTPNSALDIMVEADTVQGTEISSRQGDNIPPVYSRAGMELFTAPQTLVNADDDASFSARANPILDKFRPLMTLEELSLTIEPSRGLMSFKRGTLSFILHDRSRLPEVAEFIRADLYGTNEITIEYGWTHPDGESLTAENAYGDLINGMRMKEKFMVTNSSFNFDPAGQVSIKLLIAMRGSTEFNTELMSSDSQTFSNIIREIEQLQRQIAELRQRAFPASTATTSVEIRGRQILDAAQDATNNPILGSDLRDALTEFRNAYRTSDNPSTRSLLDRINELYGDQVQQRRRGQQGQRRQPSGQPTAFARLTRTIRESIQRKVENLQSTPDPFLAETPGNSGQRYIVTSRNALPASERRGQQRFNNRFPHVIDNRAPVSLGKLLLTFVGEPLANTGNYDEVQMFFYPFNEYAGKASALNIANFVVDTEYFADELARYRLEHISRTSVMSLRQFMNFIAETLVDDPAANSYGLADDEGSLFREQFPNEDGTVRQVTSVEEDPSNYQIRLERILQGVTPDGSFRMPEVGIYVESLPEKIGFESGQASDETNGRTILRLHVFDRTATTYESLGRLLLATRSTEIRSIGRLPNVRAGNQAVVDNRARIARTTLNAATNLGLIEWLPTEATARSSQEQVEGAAQDSDRMYRIVGGSQKLKEFIMANSPYIIFGAGGTTVKNAQLSSMQNSQLATVNLLRSMRREEQITPNGENLGGLPMQIIPTQLTMDVVGNPLINFLQSYFIDFQTGTTADNMYRVTGVEHKFIQGDFTTSVRFGPHDAWGTYRSLISSVGNALDVLRDTVAQENENNTNASGNGPGGSGG